MRTDKEFGFTGTQEDLKPKQQMALSGVIRDLAQNENYFLMYNGDCIGADFTAACLARAAGLEVWGLPPINPDKRAFFEFDGQETPHDYRTRNQAIVNGSQLLVACPKEMQEELRSGTWMTIRMARRKGIPICLVWPDGRVTWES